MAIKAKDKPDQNTSISVACVATTFVLLDPAKAAPADAKPTAGRPAAARPAARQDAPAARGGKS
jgi:hypothetical protein